NFNQRVSLGRNDLLIRTFLSVRFRSIGPQTPFTLHAIWPFLWIWATLYQPERGWGMQSHIMSNGKDPDPEIAALAARITQLEKRLDGEKKTDYSTFPEI
ncbi:TPA: DUF3302 domain-containing protein, partial [Citrobacter freundii]|nr:DUF3302 domain-containing protein [Citrobacter freundii]